MKKGLKRKISLLLVVVMCMTTMFANLSMVVVAEAFMPVENVSIKFVLHNTNDGTSEVVNTMTYSYMDGEVLTQFGQEAGEIITSLIPENENFMYFSVGKRCLSEEDKVYNDYYSISDYEIYGNMASGCVRDSNNDNEFFIDIVPLYSDKDTYMWNNQLYDNNGQYRRGLTSGSYLAFEKGTETDTVIAAFNSKFGTPEVSILPAGLKDAVNPKLTYSIADTSADLKTVDALLTSDSIMIKYEIYDYAEGYSSGFKTFGGETVIESKLELPSAMGGKSDINWYNFKRTSSLEDEGSSIVENKLIIDEDKGIYYVYGSVIDKSIYPEEFEIKVGDIDVGNSVDSKTLTEDIDVSIRIKSRFEFESETFDLIFRDQLDANKKKTVTLTVDAEDNTVALGTVNTSFLGEGTWEADNCKYYVDGNSYGRLNIAVDSKIYVKIPSLDTMEIKTIEIDYVFGMKLKDYLSQYLNYNGENKPNSWRLLAANTALPMVEELDDYYCYNPNAGAQYNPLVIMPKYSDKALVKLAVTDLETNKQYEMLKLYDLGQQTLSFEAFDFNNIYWGSIKNVDTCEYASIDSDYTINLDKADYYMLYGTANISLFYGYGKGDSDEELVKRVEENFAKLRDLAKLRKAQGIGDGSLFVKYNPKERTNVLIAKTVARLIDEELKKAAEAREKGEDVDPFVMTLDCQNATLLQSELLEMIKGNDADMVLEMKDGDEAYSWTINGNDITADTPEDINLEVKMDTDVIDDSVVKEIAGDNDYREISLTHEGNFGFKATLKLFAGLDYIKKIISLIWVKDDGSTELIKDATVDAKGYINLPFSHASNYLLVVNDTEEKKPESKLPEETTVEEIKVTKDTATNTAKVEQKVEVGTNDTAKATDGSVKLTQAAATQLADVVKDAIQTAKDTATAGTKVESTVVTIDLADATVVPVEILEAAKGKDVEVVLEMKTGDTSYSWAINGADITADTLKEINLEVKMVEDVVKEDTVKELAGEKDSLQISLTHDGEFGFDATLKINVGKDHAGKYINMYWVKADGSSELIEAAKVDANGDVELLFKHASDYLLVVDEVDRTAKTNDTAPNTGDNLPVLPMASLLLASMAAIGVLAKKRMDVR